MIYLLPGRGRPARSGLMGRRDARGPEETRTLGTAIDTAWLSSRAQRGTLEAPIKVPRCAQDDRGVVRTGARIPSQTLSRRTALVLAPASLLFTGGCLDQPCEERNPAQKAFLDAVRGVTKPALASNNPLQIEEADKQCVALSEQVGAFSDWCGVLGRIEGNAQAVAVTIQIGRQVSLYAFNDRTLAFAGSIADFFSTRSREPPPPGLSDPAIAALKTLRLGERVSLSGRMGEIAGAGMFDMSRLFGKSDAEHREFLQAPRLLARIEAITAAKRK